MAIKSKLVKLEKAQVRLADERTLLAYIRTALSVFIFAIFILKFFPDYPDIFLIFITIVILGVIILTIGFVEYFVFLSKTKK